MTRRWRIVSAIGIVALVASAIAFVAVLRHGFSARDEPWAIEAFIARRVRRLATPSGVSHRVRGHRKSLRNVWRPTVERDGFCFPARLASQWLWGSQ